MKASSLLKKYFSQIDKNKLLELVRNKFFIASLIFVVLIVFIDDKNMFEIKKSKNKLNELEAEQNRLQKEIYVQKNEIQELDKKENIEKLAREKYLMKKEDEDLYIILEEGENPK